MSSALLNGRVNHCGNRARNVSRWRLTPIVNGLLDHRQSRE